MLFRKYATMVNLGKFCLLLGITFSIYNVWYIRSQEVRGFEALLVPAIVLAIISLISNKALFVVISSILTLPFLSFSRFHEEVSLGISPAAYIIGSILLIWVRVNRKKIQRSNL